MVFQVKIIRKAVRNRPATDRNSNRSMTFNATIRYAYPYPMAVSTIVITPILILFPFGQKTFIEGFSMTGIKE